MLEKKKINSLFCFVATAFAAEENFYYIWHIINTENKSAHQDKRSRKSMLSVVMQHAVGLFKTILVYVHLL